MADTDQAPSRFIDPPAIVREQENPRDVNADLLAEARAHVAALTKPDALPPYSRYLTGLGNDIDTFSLATNKEYNPTAEGKTVVVDPFKMDVARALNLPADASVNLATGGVETGAETSSAIYETMHTSARSRLGSSIYLTSPHALNDTSTHKQILVPMLLADTSFDINGLTQEQRIDFANRHESWHCRDGMFDISDAEHKKAAPFTQNPSQILGDKEAYTALAKVQNAESFADIGATGDMIRKGASIDTIDSVAAWRTQRSSDVLHMTTNSLTALKSEIEAMGVDKFRNLTDKQATDLYVKVAQENGFKPETFENFTKYWAASPDERKVLQTDNADNPEFNRAKTLFDASQDSSGSYRMTGVKVSVIEELRQWTGLKEMEDRAIKDHGKITPETMIKSYAALQTDMQNQLKDAPNDPIIPEKMAKLQKTFVDTLRHLDYATENRYYGVNITDNQEPAQTKPNNEVEAVSTSTAKTNRKPAVQAPHL